MKHQNFLSILDANSFIIDSGPKVGKMTFVSYLITVLFKEKAIIFTPQESFLYKRRMRSLSKQFLQLKNIEDVYSVYNLKEEWHTLKQKYGYAFFLQELEHIIATSDEKIIVIHRIAEYFEFQDRYEIDTIYKSLVKMVTSHEKKIIFLANNKHENYVYVHNVAEEFSDVLISINTNERSERLINIKDVLHNQEYPLMSFKINKETFLLDYYQEKTELAQDRVKNVLIVELDTAGEDLRDVCSYIFNKPNFVVKYADSLQSILQEIFVSPDIIVVMMKRTKANLDTIKTIKTQLPNSPIVTILDQDFVRAEDAQEAYNYGCDELFSNNLALENLILAFQKASKSLFYTQEINKLKQYPNIMSSIDEMRELAKSCMERSIFFTAFVFKAGANSKKITHLSRQYDYIYQTDEKLYYLAISTAPKDAKHIIAKYNDFEIFCMWEPINHTKIEDCLQ